ncbi:MAG: hypothetical protein ACT4QD_02295 [Acidobacteriota bacterium]
MTTKRFLTALFGLTCMLTLACFTQVTPSAQAKFDLSGEWVFDVQTDQGAGSPSFVFMQKGEKLTGKYKGLFGEADLAGAVTGKMVKFSFNADAQGTPVTIVYEGEIESNSSVKGKVDLGGVGQGTFTGKRTK